MTTPTDRESAFTLQFLNFPQSAKESQRTNLAERKTQEVMQSIVPQVPTASSTRKFNSVPLGASKPANLTEFREASSYHETMQATIEKIRNLNAWDFVCFIQEWNIHIYNQLSFPSKESCNLEKCNFKPIRSGVRSIAYNVFTFLEATLCNEEERKTKAHLQQAIFEKICAFSPENFYQTVTLLMALDALNAKKLDEVRVKNLCIDLLRQITQQLVEQKLPCDKEELIAILYALRKVSYDIRKLNITLSNQEEEDSLLKDLYADESFQVEVMISKLFSYICDRLYPSIDRLTAQQLTLITKAFAQANFKERDFLNIMQKALLAKIECGELNVNEAAYVIWSSCYKSAKNLSLDEFYGKLRQLIQGNMDQLNNDRQVRVLWSLAKLGYLNVDFLKTACIHIKIDQLSVEGKINLIGNLAQLAQNSDPLLIELLNTVKPHIGVNPSNALLNLDQQTQILRSALIKYCYGYVNKKTEQPNPYFAQFLKDGLETIANADLTSCTKDSLHKLSTIYKIYLRTSQNLGYEAVSKEAQKRIETLLGREPIPSDAYNDQDKKPKPSWMQREITQYISELLQEKCKTPPKMREEYPFEGFSIDVAFPEKNIYVEIDGPCHFDENHQRVHKDLIKETMILLDPKNTLIRITYDEWKRCQNDNEKNSFLIRKLACLFPESSDLSLSRRSSQGRGHRSRYDVNYQRTFK